MPSPTAPAARVSPRDRFLRCLPACPVGQGLDEAALKEKYFQQAALLHPDASAGDTEEFSHPSGGVPDPFRAVFPPPASSGVGFSAASPAPMRGDLFMQVGQAVQNAQSILQRLEKTADSAGPGSASWEVASALEGCPDRLAGRRGQSRFVDGKSSPSSTLPGRPPMARNWESPGVRPLFRHAAGRHNCQSGNFG